MVGLICHQDCPTYFLHMHTLGLAQWLQWSIPMLSLEMGWSARQMECGSPWDTLFKPTSLVNICTQSAHTCFIRNSSETTYSTVITIQILMDNTGKCQRILVLLTWPRNVDVLTSHEVFSCRKAYTMTIYGCTIHSINVNMAQQRLASTKQQDET